MCLPSRRLITDRAPKPPTPPSPPVASPDEKRAALESHRQLTQTLNNLRKSLQTPSPDAQKLLNDSIRHLATLSHYLSATIEPKNYNEHIPPSTSPTASAAHRTLAIPELFELILSHLSIPDILSFAQTSQEHKLRIDGSPYLQTLLCLRAAPRDSNFLTPFSHCLANHPAGGFHAKRRSHGRAERLTAPSPDSRVDVIAAFLPLGDEQRLPCIGPTWRRMFVTQPPVREMVPSLRCCGGLEPVVREEGVRVGDLWDVASELVEKHRWCARSGLVRMMENGQNKVRLIFETSVQLSPTDPIITQHRQEIEGKAVENARADRVRKRNRAYLRAKGVAESTGNPIPSMPQWLETNPYWDQEPDPELSDPLGFYDLEGIPLPADAFSFT